MTSLSEYWSNSPLRTVSFIALLLIALSPRAAAVSRSSWSSSANTSALIGSADESFFLYARSVLHVCSVDMFKDPKPRKFGFDVFRAVTPRAGSDGLLVTLVLGLGGGLTALVSPDGRLDGVSSLMVLLLGLVSKVLVGVLKRLELRFIRDVRRRNTRGGDGWRLDGDGR